MTAGDPETHARKMGPVAGLRQLAAGLRQLAGHCGMACGTLSR